MENKDKEGNLTDNSLVIGIIGNLASLALFIPIVFLPAKIAAWLFWVDVITLILTTVWMADEVYKINRVTNPKEANLLRIGGFIFPVGLVLAFLALIEMRKKRK